MTRGKHCSRCHHKVSDGVTGVNVEEIPMVEDVSHSSYTANNEQVMSYRNESTNPPPREDDVSTTSVAINTSTSEGTYTTVSANNIPIPIFKSSQYSIQRQKNFQRKGCGNFSDQPLFLAPRGRKHPKNVSDVLHSPSFSGSKTFSVG